MSKTAAMMQPYLFPYLGYFQLISAADVFVLGDDLQYVKESWINRNRILVNGKERLITFPLKKSSHRSKINEKMLSSDFSCEAERILRLISGAYAKAPCYKMVFPLIAEIIRHRDRNLAGYAENSIRGICDYMSIKTPILLASNLEIGPVMDKQERVIKTARKLEADVYINFIGGINLYDPDYFREHGIKLAFHRMQNVTYRQNGDEFIPLLSIIDVLMFNDVQAVREKLFLYTLQDKLCNSAFGSPPRTVECRSFALPKIVGEAELASNTTGKAGGLV